MREEEAQRAAKSREKHLLIINLMHGEEGKARQAIIFLAYA